MMAERVTTSGGWDIVLHVTRPERDASDWVAVVFPAMGASARAYRHIANALARRGCPAVVVDPRGVGASGPVPSRNVDFTVNAHLDHDWPSALSAVRGLFPARRLLVLGHSFGGLLSAMHLASNPADADALVLLTSGSLHWRAWDPARRWGVLSGYHAFALIARVCGYLPGQRLGWGCPIAKGVVFDWARWGVTGRYCDRTGRDLGEALARLAMPVLAVSFEDDRVLAPPQGVDDLVRRLPRAPVTRWRLAPSDLGAASMGHFRFLKDCDKLCDRVDSWTRSVAAPDFQ